MSGRPLRFLGVVLGGWVAVRAAMLWPSASPVTIAATPPPSPPLRPQHAAVPNAMVVTPSAPTVVVTSTAAPRRTPAAHPVAAWQRHPGDPARVALSLLGMTRLGMATPVAQARPPAGEPPISPALAFPRAAPGAPRLSGSAWLIARGGNGLSQSPFGGQLGGSQAGVRIAYAIDRARRVALVGRFATPLSGVGREAAAGIEWRPSRLPVRLVAEQRIAIDGGGGGPAVGLIGGVGPVPIGSFRLEAYGQAGVIGRGNGIGYADGMVRIDRAIVTRRRVSVTAGVGAWSAAQPGAERVDVGPVVAATLPVADRRVRIAVEWRARVGGQATPRSGIALSIGGDF